jgi:hypothetical protein
MILFNPDSDLVTPQDDLVIDGGRRMNLNSLVRDAEAAPGTRL